MEAANKTKDVLSETAEAEDFAAAYILKVYGDDYCRER